MKRVKFFELDAENKLIAVQHMFSFQQRNNWPAGVTWESEEDLKTSLEQDFDPNQYFSFYVNEFDEVETKIG